MNLGENIRKARKAAGVTQKELAERLQVYPKEAQEKRTETERQRLPLHLVAEF